MIDIATVTRVYLTAKRLVDFYSLGKKLLGPPPPEVIYQSGEVLMVGNNLVSIYINEVELRLKDFTLSTYDKNLNLLELHYKHELPKAELGKILYVKFETKEGGAGRFEIKPHILPNRTMRWGRPAKSWPLLLADNSVDNFTYVPPKTKG